MIRNIAKAILPRKLKNELNALKNSYTQKKVKKLPPINENDFRDILVNQLEINTGNTVFIHSSIDKLNLSFPFYKVISLLLEVVGKNGTILFPTYPKENAYQTLLKRKFLMLKKHLLIRVF